MIPRSAKLSCRCGVKRGETESHLLERYARRGRYAERALSTPGKDPGLILGCVLVYRLTRDLGETKERPSLRLVFDQTSRMADITPSTQVPRPNAAPCVTSRKRDRLGSGCRGCNDHSIGSNVDRSSSTASAADAVVNCTISQRSVGKSHNAACVVFSKNRRCFSFVFEKNDNRPSACQLYATSDVRPRIPLNDFHADSVPVEGSRGESSRIRSF